MMNLSARLSPSYPPVTPAAAELVMSPVVSTVDMLIAKGAQMRQLRYTDLVDPLSYHEQLQHLLTEP